MKKISLIVIIYIAFCNLSSAQKSAKSVFFEIAGPGLASVNYDMRFNKKEDGLGFRVGVGGFSLNHNIVDSRYTLVLVPIGLNYLLGKDGKNYFEVGAGISGVFASEKYANDKTTFNSTFGHLNFGYRLQPKNGGFTFRAAINPIFSSSGFLPYYAGISFGYKF